MEKLKEFLVIEKKIEEDIAKIKQCLNYNNSALSEVKLNYNECRNTCEGLSIFNFTDAKKILSSCKSKILERTNDLSVLQSFKELF